MIWNNFGIVAPIVNYATQYTQGQLHRVQIAGSGPLEYGGQNTHTSIKLILPLQTPC